LWKFWYTSIEQIFFINDAIKYDRGELKDERKFVLRPDEIDRIKLEKNIFGFEEHTILTGNQLFNLNSENGNIIFNEIVKKYTDININDKIAEMEVYDFFKICQFYKFKCIGAFKIVSDLCGGNSKDDRILFFSMENIKKDFVIILNTFYQTGFLNINNNLINLELANTIIKEDKSKIEVFYKYYIRRYDIVNIFNITLESLTVLMRYNRYEMDSVSGLTIVSTIFLLEQRYNYFNRMIEERKKKIQDFDINCLKLDNYNDYTINSFVNFLEEIKNIKIQCKYEFSKNKYDYL